MSLISYLTRIHFAAGVIGEALPGELDRLTVKRVLVVTDRHTVEAGLLDRIKSAIPANIAITVFDRTPDNPTETACQAAAELYTAEGCDGIIGLGSDAVLDLAKAAGLLATHRGSLAYYAAVEGGIARIKNVMPPSIAVPTTAGTGTEVAGGAVIVLGDQRKVGLISPYLIPAVAICDPELTVDLSPLLTAGTGMDAITHCVETYIATAYNPPADGIALDGLKRAANNIERAVNDGKDIEARREMMAAALEGALAFQKGLGGVHAISHALGGLPGYRLHHGTLNAVLLPHVLDFNAPAVGQRYDGLARAMNLRSGGELGNYFMRLKERIALPASLGHMGVDHAAIERAAPLAASDHTNTTNPRKASVADYRDIMRAAL
jgi:alcohol dehydrogenase class IV